MIRPARPAVLIGLLLALSGAPALANDPGADGLFGRDVRGGVALKGRIWLHGLGALAWFDLATHVRHVEIPNGVLDAAKWNGEVWALRRRADLPAPDPSRSRYSAYYWRGGGFFELPPLTAKTADGPQKLAMSAAGPRLVGRGAIWSLPRNGSRWSERAVRWPKGESGRDFAAAAASADGRSVYLAHKGGPLIRLDTASGRAAGLGGGPVVGLAQDPKQPACVLVAYADRLARACGAEVKPIPATPAFAEPLTGVAAEGDVVWAASRAAAYRVTGGKAERLPLPAWTPLTDLEISRPAPEAVLVLSNLSAHAADTPAPLLLTGP
ncbi:MAG TPA: hypothetical protein VG939_12160 [Caulobacteraceae bacterium]|nr:hypothetical protein [Caulobacteraceae bacterium]